jgi:glycosyltransferase involved in cell wall biosynthesis
MPAFNSELYIAEAIESILNQTYKNIQLFIFDDGSTDNTRAVIEKYDDPRIVKILSLLRFESVQITIEKITLENVEL